MHGSLSYIMLGVFQRQATRDLYKPPLPRQRYAVVSQPLVVPDAATPPIRPPADPPLPRMTPPTPLAPRAMALLPPPPAPPADAALPTVPAPKAKALAKLPDIEDLPEVNSEFGQHEGKGASMHASAGNTPMLARKGPQDQAWISRDDAGTGDPNNLPSKDAGAPGEPGLIAPEIVKPDPPQPVELTALTPAQPRAFGVTTPQPDIPRSAAPAQPATPATPATPAPAPQPNRATTLGRGPLDRPADKPSPATRPASQPESLLALANNPQPSTAVPPGRSATRPAVTPAPQPQIAHTGEQGDNGTGKAGTTAADPAPMSDSESDAFSTTGAAVFRNGKLEARFGRQVKTIRPRLNLAGRQDLLSLPSPSVVLKVRADQTGRVRNVEVIKSSGSNEVDQPCVLAMYDWWIEPAKDKSGKTTAAEMTWTISWR